MARNEEISNNLNILGSGTAIVGNIVSQGDVRVDGSLEGNLTTQSKLVIGTTGRITGEIKCRDCEVSGNVKGKIFVENLLMLKATALVEGEIRTTKLAIEPNAVFSGTCSMSSSEPQVDEQYNG
ncbi:MAG: polymer-forming cytoskeletal protein [Bacteroidales bacterium]|nr:polymer-forming cytoskeletal protein [Bacteroidales bacterium]